jgi:hypothetical protein
MNLIPIVIGCNLNTMSQEIEERIERIPLLRNFAHYLKG